MRDDPVAHFVVTPVARVALPAVICKMNFDGASLEILIVEAAQFLLQFGTIRWEQHQPEPHRVDRANGDASQAKRTSQTRFRRRFDRIGVAAHKFAVAVVVFRFGLFKRDKRQRTNRAVLRADAALRADFRPGNDTRVAKFRCKHVPACKKASQQRRP